MERDMRHPGTGTAAPVWASPEGPMLYTMRAHHHNECWASWHGLSSGEAHPDTRTGSVLMGV